MKMRCEGRLPGKVASWIYLRFVSITYNSVVPFTCNHVFKMSACIDAYEEMPVRSRHEQILTGVEGENQVRRKKVIARRRLVPLS